MTITDTVAVFAPAVAAFLLGLSMTPALTHYLYSRKMWKKRGGKTAFDGTSADVFNSLHTEKEVGTPRFGGVIVWGSVLLAAGLLYVAGLVTHSNAAWDFSFISRGETWLPLATLALGALVGLVDDLYEVQGIGGLRLRIRLLFVGAAALFCAWWFYDKLDVSSIAIPFDGTLELGILFIPFFVIVALSAYAGGVIDGIDGLAGGVFASMFAAYGAIALVNGQIDLAAFCATIVGGLLAFLWFNIPPARFYLSETGTMGLTLTLTVVAFLSDTLSEGVGVFVLPIIALPLVATVGSVVLQIFWKRVLGRKLLRVAPLHHHFEAIGWPAYKVAMRYWVVSIMAAVTGVTIALLG